MPFKQQIEAYKPSNEQEANDQRIILEYIKNFPETILTRENEIAHLTSSGFIINPTRDKVLMIHHNIYQTWAWTGGHTDGDRDLLAVAIKEAKEETGLKKVSPLTGEIDAIDILPVWGHIKKDKYVSVHLHLNVAYVLIAEEGQELRINEAENSGVKWLPIEELGKYCNEPQIIEIYKKLIKKSKKVNSTKL
ncbi:MAG: NUDIX hydrolase [Cellulosilyticaceae bacterium]